MSNSNSSGIAKLLIICDEPVLTEFWSNTLLKRNIDTYQAASRNDALTLWLDILPDLIICHIYGQNFGEIELCRTLRNETIVPILLFGPYQDEAYALQAYAAGVDECGPNHIGPLLFLAKVAAWLRHTLIAPAGMLLETVQGHGFILCPEKREITLNAGDTLKLSNLESRLLHLLMSRPGWYMDSDNLIARIWGPFGNGDNTLLKNVVYRLRKKLEPDPANPVFIHNQPGLGYKYEAPSM